MVCALVEAAADPFGGATPGRPLEESEEGEEREAPAEPEAGEAENAVRFFCWPLPLPWESWDLVA